MQHQENMQKPTIMKIEGYNDSFNFQRFSTNDVFQHGLFNKIRCEKWGPLGSPQLLPLRVIRRKL